MRLYMEVSLKSSQNNLTNVPELGESKAYSEAIVLFQEISDSVLKIQWEGNVSNLRGRLNAINKSINEIKNTELKGKLISECKIANDILVEKETPWYKNVRSLLSSAAFVIGIAVLVAGIGIATFGVGAIMATLGIGILATAISTGAITGGGMALMLTGIFTSAIPINNARKLQNICTKYYYDHFSKLQEAPKPTT